MCRIWGEIRYNRREFSTEYWTLQIIHAFKEEKETGLSCWEKINAFEFLFWNSHRTKLHFLSLILVKLYLILVILVLELRSHSCAKHTLFFVLLSSPHITAGDTYTVSVENIVLNIAQGGHGTGKTGNWFLLFPDRENTGNFVVTQGKFLSHRENIFDNIHWCKKHVSLHIFSKIFASLRSALFLVSEDSFLYYFYQYIYSPTFFLYHICYKYQPNLFRQFWKTYWINVNWNVYIQEFFKHFNRK